MPLPPEEPPIARGKPPTKANSKAPLPARRPTSAQRAAPQASPGTRWAIIAASAAGILVAVGLLVFALSGGSESALLVIAEPREGVQIAVDGMAFPNGQVVTPFPEGEHELVVSGTGYKSATQHIHVGGRSTFQVRLVPEAPAPAPEPAPAPPAPHEAAPPEPSAPEPPAEATPAKEKAHAAEPAETKKPRAERPPDVKTSRTTTTRPAEAASKKKKTGTLACTSNPLGAEVIIDGRPTGRRTPVPFGSAIELPVGKHKLTLKAGTQSVTATIEIREGEVTTIRNAVLQ
jgi:outer membrane biosynthesis protein TonB